MYTLCHPIVDKVDSQVPAKQANHLGLLSSTNGLAGALTESLTDPSANTATHYSVYPDAELNNPNRPQAHDPSEQPLVHAELAAYKE